MGGGISLSQEGVEEMIATTILIGRAISAISFPGMYRLYDFHSRQAPRLKNEQKFSFFVTDDEDESDDDETPEPDPAQYEHFFKVSVGTDTIYLEKPLQCNEAGWTPLHTCCMSMNTVTAGLALVDETVHRGESLENKTYVGPGTFNKGWTPLQMACAYGVEPLVEKLVEAGADVNATNSFGYSCLLEACHRGFQGIVLCLTKNPKLKMDYIPSAEDTRNSPFSNSPAQAALGEAARCGFHKVVQILLDAGVSRDQTNSIGWTALHEACFYNRIETVKTLLLGGADALQRTRLGALPYHLAALQEIRDMIKDMGGDGAVPQEGDRIDMMEVLTELTMPEAFNHSYADLGFGFGDDGGGAAADGGGSGVARIGDGDGEHGTKFFAETIVNPRNSNKQQQQHRLDSSDSGIDIRSDVADEGGRLTPRSGAAGGGNRADSKASSVNPTTPLLHSGPMLGDLPSLTSAEKSSPGKQIRNDLDTALNIENRSKSGLFANSNTPKEKSNNPSRKADEKNRKEKKKKPHTDLIPKDMPQHFICQLTQRPMSDPVKTSYGNIYDKTAILNWLNTQGHIDPLTGAPLSEIDLKPVEELGNEIRQWLLKKSLSGSGGGSSSSANFGAGAGRAGSSVDQTTTDDKKAEQDSLYDF